MERRIAAGEFKATCLALLDEVQRERKAILITKRGKAVARLVPLDDSAPALFGRMKGTGVITGDIVGPTGAIWDVDR
jgi:prevent-host-death family protein